MKCIILCAGYGTRLYPLTIDKPKPLLDIDGRTMLDHIIDRIEQVQEIDSLFIATNDKFYMQFVWWLNNYKGRKKIEIINDGTSTNETRIGGIGDLALVIESKGIDDDILVIAGDNLFFFDMKRFIDFFNEKKGIAVALYDVKSLDEAKRFGVVALDSSLRIIDFEEKPEAPKSTLISTACYIFRKEDLQGIRDYMKTGNNKDGPGFLIKHFYPEKGVYGFVFSEPWFDIGSIEQYNTVRGICGKHD